MAHFLIDNFLFGMVVYLSLELSVHTFHGVFIFNNVTDSMFALSFAIRKQAIYTPLLSLSLSFSFTRTLSDK